MTNNILSSKNYTLLMVTRKIEDADPELLNKGYELASFCRSDSIGFHILTASGSEQVRAIGQELPFLFADETTLKTMVRSNPGYLLLREGTILHKWSWANLPDKEEILKIITETNQNN
jgi:triosephosphate isomerase